MDGVIIERVPLNRFFRRKVKFWFGMYVWQSITDRSDIAYEDIGSIDEHEFICMVLYYAAEYGSLKDKRRVLSEKQIKKTYEIMPQKQLQRIVNCMLESQYGGDTLIGNVEKGKKKQGQGKSKT